MKPFAIIKGLLSHQGVRRYLGNAGWVLAEQVLRIVAGLLVGIYVARYLGPEQFGMLSYVIAFVAMFTAIAKLGLDGLAVRDLVRLSDGTELYLGTVFWLKIMGALLAVAATVAAAALFEDDAQTVLFICIIACGMLFQTLEVADFYFQSQVKSKYVSLGRIFQLSASSLLKLYLIVLSADLLWFVLASLVDQVLLAAALLSAYSKRGAGAFWFRFDRQLAEKLLRAAFPLLASGLMVSVYSSVDRVIIKEMLGAREVGLYVAATGLVTAFYFLPMLIASAMFPALVNAKQSSPELYERRLSLLYKYLLLLGLVVCLIFAAFAAPLVGLLYGQGYAESTQVLQIYAWNFLVICFSAAFGKWLLSEDLQHLTPRFTLMAICVNVAGCLLLIPLWSIRGAAMAALGAQLIPLVWFGMSNKEIRSQLRCAFRFRSRTDSIGEE